MTWSGYRKVRAKIHTAVIFLCLVFLIANYAIDESRYALYSSKAAAQVTSVQPVTRYSRYTWTTHSVKVFYQFPDPNVARDSAAPFGMRAESDEMPVNWAPPADGVITVQYIPGQPGSSRMTGHTRSMPIAVCLVVAALALARLRRGYYAR